MSEPKLINLGRAVIDTNGVIVIFKNRETTTLLGRILQAIGVRGEQAY